MYFADFPAFFTFALKRAFVVIETLLLPALKAIAPAVAVLVPFVDPTVVTEGVVAGGVVAGGVVAGGVVAGGVVAGGFDGGVLGEGAEGAAATVTTAAFEATSAGVFDPAVFVTTAVYEPASDSTTDGIE